MSSKSKRSKISKEVMMIVTLKTLKECQKMIDANKRMDDDKG